MIPSQTVEINITCIYIFSSLANRTVGMIIAESIIKPPIVGVPDFLSSPFKPSFLTSSPI